MSHKKYNIIDIFSGCGGLSYGFQETNRFKTVLAIDIGQSALNTLKKNEKGADILKKDMNKITKKEIAEIKKAYGNIKVVVGGPPCQGFSNAGKRKKGDPRNELYKNYVKFLDIIRPEWFVFENVLGLLSMKDANGEKIINKIVEEFESIGYNLTINKISAKNFGVPQDRKRVIIIGNNKGIKIPQLKPTTLKETLTVRDAIGDLESLESGEKSENDPYHFAVDHVDRHIKRLKNVPEGKSAHDYKPDNGMEAKGYNTTYKRIWRDRPSPTITTCFSSISSQNNVHPSDTRALTIREAMRLQTFPDDFIFSGTKTDIRKQIGNAVPPLLGKKIAEHILKQFNK